MSLLAKGHAECSDDEDESCNAGQNPADQSERTPLPVARAISHLAVQQGLLLYPGGHHGNVLGFLPPLIVTQDQLSTCASLVANILNGAAFDDLKPAAG